MSKRMDIDSEVMRSVHGLEYLQMARDNGIPDTTYYMRIKRGKSPKDAATTPLSRWKQISVEEKELIAKSYLNGDDINLITETYRISRTTVYKYANEYKAKKECNLGRGWGW